MKRRVLFRVETRERGIRTPRPPPPNILALFVTLFVPSTVFLHRVNSKLNFKYSETITLPKRGPWRRPL